MSSKSVLICVAAAAGVAGFLAGRASKAERVVTQLVPASRESRVLTDPPPEVVLAESPSSRIAVIQPVAAPGAEPKEPTIEEALASLDRALRNQPIGDGTDAEFERKYRNVNLATARAAMLRLSERVTTESKAIVEQRMASGEFEERRADDGLGLVERSLGRGGTMYSTQALGADGVMTTRVTSFEFKDYPSLEAANLELQYLQGMMHVPTPPPTRSPR